MKKAVTLLAVLTIFTGVYAASNYSIPSKGPLKATEIYLTGVDGSYVSLFEFSSMTAKEYEKFSGKHLNFFGKVSFKLSQRKLKNSIAPDGTVTNKKLAKAFMAPDNSTGFHIGGFALGFLLGPIGVLIAYLIKEGGASVSSNRIKWAWIGFGIGVVLYLLLLL